MHLFLFSLFAVSFKNDQSGFDNNSYFGKDTVSAIGKYSSNSFLESRQKVSTREVHSFTGSSE